MQIRLLPSKAATQPCRNDTFLLNNKGAIASGIILADIVVVDNLEDFNVENCFSSDGKLVFDGEVKDFSAPTVDEKLAEKCFDTFHLDSVTPSSFKVDGKLGLIGTCRR